MDQTADEESGAGTSIIVCGQRFSIGAPVVLWTDPGGYDAYATVAHFDGTRADGPVPGSLRYDPGRITRGDEKRRLVAGDSRDLQELRSVVDQFVLHYDVCGTSERCFKVLHDMRGLSVHFMLDVDGTLYQTLDLREQCWHATISNTRSIGIEIAHIGARSQSKVGELDEWYAKDGSGPYLRFPRWVGDGGVRTTGFVGRPARRELVRERIQGEMLSMYDMTAEQYDTLVALTATLCEVFPKIQCDAPRGADGRVVDKVLSAADWAAFQGVLGHYHVQRNKVDPGPAFNWESFLTRSKQRMRENARP